MCMLSMNKYRLWAIVACALSLTALSSCKSDLLDLKPIDHYGTNNYWNNHAQVEANYQALNGILRGNYSVFRAFGELRAGTMKFTVSATGESQSSVEVKQSVLDADRPGLLNWGGFYGDLLHINLFIKKVETQCPFLTDAERKTYLGKAYGIRAYIYFVLYKSYGGVVLETEPRVAEEAITDPTSYHKARSSAEETLDFIKKDVEKSSELLATSPWKSIKTEWSRAATELLKAEVYLWSAKVTTGNHTATGEADLRKAKTALEGIVGSQAFELEDKFAANFDAKKKNGKEIILNLYFDRQEATNDYGHYMYQNRLFVGSARDKDGVLFPGDTLKAMSTGILYNEYKPSFVASFDEDDTRRSATFFEFTVGTPGNLLPGSVFLKYQGQLYSDNAHIYDSNVILYRYADVLLLLAEVKNALGEDPSTELNLIRKRAFGNKFAGHEFVSGDFAANELAILKERDHEFAGEYKRWYDLLRLQDASKQPLVFSPAAAYSDDHLTGTAPTPILKTTERQKLLWPVDRTVLNNDPLIKQTEGY